MTPPALQLWQDYSWTLVLISVAQARTALSLYHSASQSNQHTAQTDFIYARSLAENVVGVTCRAAFS